MRAYHPIEWFERVRWHDILYDRRFWGAISIVAFIAVVTTLMIIGAGIGNTQPLQGYPYMWPYGPYGPMPVP
jgi:hypothetical protein